MIVSNVQRDTVGLITNLLQVYTTSMSTVPALVAFRLLLDGIQLTPIGGFTGTEIKTFSLSTTANGEVSYERLAANLIHNEISLANTGGSTPIQLTPTVNGFKKTVHIESSGGKGESGRHIAIPNTGDMVTKGRSYDCCGDYKTAIFELLFVPRNLLKNLPPEFDAFRVWEDWLTLGKSYASVANVRPTINDEEQFYQVVVEPKYPQLEDAIKYDISVLASTFVI